jgi:cytoskeletal protein CcmA (bactofilin family)
MWGQEKKPIEQVNEGNEGEGNAEVASEKPVQGAQDISAFVGKGVEFKGTISYSGTVRIDGYLDGEIHTDGVLLIGEDAVLQAKITAGTVVCKGKVTGDIVVKEQVKLRAPAVVNGSVKTPLLSMEDGVLFNGNLEMAQQVPQTSLHSVGMITPTGVKRVNG